MDDLERLVSDAIRALVIHRGGSFSWFAARDGMVRPSVGLTRKQGLGRLRMRLQHHLYKNFYCVGMAAAVEDEEDEPAAGDAPAFAEQLSRANCGKGVTLTDWNLILRPGRIKEMRGISPGFYTALGEVRLDGREPLLRIYWNVRATGAVAFIRQSARLFNEQSIPFRAKVIDDPQAFLRCDAAVLYVQRRDHQEIWPLIDVLQRRLHRHLKASTPVFAKRIARGVAIAEDPAGRESFGEHRCGIVADGLIRAHEKGCTTTEARLHEVIAQFKRRGISFRQPFLSRGSEDVYPLLRS